MKPTTDRQWLINQAALEDNCFVSVGGLVGAVEDLDRQPTTAATTRRAFARLLELVRREHRLTWEQFSEKLDVELDELIGIASDERYKPAPRTVTRIAQFVRVPAEKLFVLSGLARPRDVHFQEEALRFAARSQPAVELSHEEHEALEEYVKFLCDQ